MKKEKWFKGEHTQIYCGKKRYYSFGTNKNKSYLIISPDPMWSSGSFFEVKDFKSAKKTVQSLETK